MTIFNDISFYKNSITDTPCVLVLGDFDGVHLGHRKLINKAKEISVKTGCSIGVYTFNVNTKDYFGSNNFSRLTTDDEKNRIFEQLGVDFVCYDNFVSVKDFSPEEFIKYIVNKFNVLSVVCGENYTFGKGACADSKRLLDLAKYENIGCYIIPILEIDGESVSSTSIRHHIASGNIDRATKLLGYRYFINAEIIHGAHLGRKLGFPTINQLDYDSKTIPKLGVYACVCIIDGERYRAVSNVGVKPTVSSCKNPPVIFETHIIDYSGDLYGKCVTVEFCKMLREEQKFSSLDELHDNVIKNISQTKELFNSGKILL